MEVINHYSFDIDSSVSRIDNYLVRAVDTEMVSDIPSRTDFSYDNGYYVNCCAIFIDMRDSSDLTDEISKNRAARIYRSFVSEMTAIMQSYSNCKEINFAGDCVSGIFDAKTSDNILDVFMCVASLNSQMMLLNDRLKLHEFPEIQAGIGVSYGQAFVVMSGYKGSGLKDLVWTGDVVNSASHVCNQAGKDGYDYIIATPEFYERLGTLKCTRAGGIMVQCKTFFEKRKEIYQGNFWLVAVERWVANH